MGKHTGKHTSSPATTSPSPRPRRIAIGVLVLVCTLLCMSLFFAAPHISALTSGWLNPPSTNTSTQDTEQATVLDPTASQAPTSTQDEKNQDLGDTTPLETGPDAAITSGTTPGGIAVTAPDGFLDTPSCKRVDEALATLQAQGYNVGFVMFDVSTGRSMSFNADERMYPASAIKAAYCTMVMQTNGGPAGMSSTIENCLVNSSNDAFHTLIDTFGLASYSSWLQQHGAPAAGTDASVYYYPWISANELAAVWQEIWRYGTSGEAGSAELAGYLARTNHTAMGALLRDSYEVWAKPGWYPADGTGLQATVDAGVVNSDCGAYVLVIMTDASEDFNALFPLIDALNAAHGKMCGGSSTLVLSEGESLPAI